MEFRDFGKTGMKLSRLGFGSMRFKMNGDKVDRGSAIPLLHRAFELGVNFVDSATFYGDGDSETAVGEALKAWKGHRVYVSTKNPVFDLNDEKQWWTNLETSLRKLQVDSIDLYNHHGIEWKTYESGVKLPKGFYRCMLKAKEQGMIKHIAISFHDTAENLRKIVDDADFASVILQYNIIDRRLEEVFPHLKKKGMGIIVMGPVAGGKLSRPDLPLEKQMNLKAPEVALRFVLSNPHVDVAISGMSDMKMLEENVRIASMTGGLSAEENARIKKLADELSGLQKLYCTGCNYCAPCPHDVIISEIFTYYIWKKVYGLKTDGEGKYNAIGRGGQWDPKGKNATGCEECGDCMEKCPQKIDIITQLKEAHKLLTSK
jgi:uncharacterized protein